MKTNLIKQNNKFKTIYLAIFLILSLIAIWGGYASVNYNFLNDSNSVKILTSDFSPDFSVHRIDIDDVGISKYRYYFSKDKMENITGNEFKIIISKLTDNAIRIRLNGRLMTSEGDFKSGQSMFKNSFIFASFELSDILDENVIEIETYSLYKSGIESKSILIARNDVAMKAIELLDFHGSKMVITALGFLFFSSVFTIYVYIISNEKDIVLVYSSLATFALCIYFVDYIKIVDLSLSYFTMKKIFIFGLATGVLFYTLAIKSFIDLGKIIWSIIILYISYIFIMLYSKNLIQFKSLYEYWYFALIANMFLFLIFFIKNRRNDSRIHIFIVSFVLLVVYTSFVLVIEFAGGFFSLSSPLIYMAILGTLPLLIGFDVIHAKDRKIIIEQKEKEMAFLASLEDSLTRAWNKRYFDIILDKIEVNDTLAMIDFDEFKKINDSYGHLAGDYILKSVSSLILKSIRKADDLCRIGGDEFVIVFSKCSEDEALKIINEIREKIKNTNFSYEDNQIKPTISAGICELKDIGEKEDMLKNIDKSLYKAKDSGRNTVVIYDHHK